MTDLSKSISKLAVTTNDKPVATVGVKDVTKTIDSKSIRGHHRGS